MSTDSSKGRRGPVVEPDPAKVRVTIRLDADTFEHFEQLVISAGGGNYQTLINEALRRHINNDDAQLETKLRKIIRGELKKARRAVV